MKLIDNLLVNISTAKKLKLRCRKKIKFKSVVREEREIRNVLGKDYSLIGNQIPLKLINKYRDILNNTAWKSERLFIEKLCQRGVVDFFVNHPLLNRFFADVFFHSLKVVVELDGSMHLKPEVRAKDERKDYWLGRFGYRIYRYQILCEADAQRAVDDFLSHVDLAFINSFETKNPALMESKPTQRAPRRRKKIKKVKKRAITWDERLKFMNFVRNAAKEDLSGMWLKTHKIEGQPKGGRDERGIQRTICNT